MSKKNSVLEHHLYDGQVIMISGVNSAYYPKTLINKIKESGVNNLTLIYLQNNDHLDPAGDPMQLIYNGQVTKLITSGLGELSSNYDQYLEDVEILPTDILTLKIQAGANKLPGIVVSYDKAALYRDKSFLDTHSFLSEGKSYVFEPALQADIGIAVVDNIDIESKNCSFDGTGYNSYDVIRAANLSFVEYKEIKNIHPDDVNIPGICIDGFVESPDGVSFRKTNQF